MNMNYTCRLYKYSFFFKHKRKSYKYEVLLYFHQILKKMSYIKYNLHLYLHPFL